MKTHHVKSWRHFYQAIQAGVKTHDLRLNDREYNVGDALKLYEYDNIKGVFTGQSCIAHITYITDNRVPCAYSSAVLPKGYCILSIKAMRGSAKMEDFTYEASQR